MKIRTGFVSNSSSSSFLVWFTTLPKSVEELQKLLFGHEQEIEKYDYVVPADTAAAIIWRDLQNQQPMTIDSMRDKLRSLAFTNVYEAWKRKGKNKRWYTIDDAALRRKLQDEHDADVEVETDRLVASYQSRGQPYCFHYSDNDGEIYTVLEHGDVFRNLQHVRISHH